MQTIGEFEMKPSFPTCQKLSDHLNEVFVIYNNSYNLTRIHPQGVIIRK